MTKEKKIAQQAYCSSFYLYNNSRVYCDAIKIKNSHENILSTSTKNHIFLLCWTMIYFQFIAHCCYVVYSTYQILFLYKIHNTHIVRIWITMNDNI